MSVTTYEELLERVVADGIEAARRDYSEPDDAERLEGSVAGFDACRGKTPEQLGALLVEARLETTEARQRAHLEERPTDVARYWYWRCRELEIEWVCNVVSAVMFNQGLPGIVPPTVRGVMKAAEIVGVADAA